MKEFWWKLRYAFLMWRLCRKSPSRHWKFDVEFSWSSAIAAVENNDFDLTPQEALHEEVSCWSD